MFTINRRLSAKTTSRQIESVKIHSLSRDENLSVAVRKHDPKSDRLRFLYSFFGTVFRKFAQSGKRSAFATADLFIFLEQMLLLSPNTFDKPTNCPPSQILFRTQLVL